MRSFWRRQATTVRAATKTGSRSSPDKDQFNEEGGYIMATSVQRPGSAYVQRSSSGGLYDVIDVILDKGLVIDIFLRVSLVGIELLTVDARIVIASVDTYLRFAEAVNRLELQGSESEGLPQLMQDITEDGSQSKARGVLEGAKESLFGSSDDDEGSSDDDEKSREGSRSRAGAGRRSK
jgi:gas vesicle structural protein